MSFVLKAAKPRKSKTGTMKVEELDPEKNSPSPTPRLVSKKHDGSACRMVFAAACAFLGPFSFGYSIGYSSPALPELEKLGMLTRSESGWFGSLLTVGALIGGPFGGWLIEKFGRRAAMKFTSIPFFLGWLCIAYWSGTQGLFLGRFLCGFASGLVTVSVPVYIAETATSSLRGTLGAGIQLSITVGILASYSAGMYFQWSDMAIIGMIPACLAFITLYFVPETPRWLLLNGKKMEAVLALRQLRYEHADCEDECRDIEEGLDLKEQFSWSEFKKPELSQPLMISVFIMVFQQFSGINAIMFYTVTIFKNAGLGISEVATVIVGAVQVVGTFVSCLLMDRMGRRRLLIIAGLSMSLSLLVMGWCYHKLNTGSSPADVGIISVICVVVYILGFSLGWGPIPMLIMSEIFPSRARGAASGIAVFTNWFCAFVVTKEFLFVQDVFGAASTFWMFAVFCACSVMFVWRKVPETKGKSLEDIELFFLGKSTLIV